MIVVFGSINLDLVARVASLPSVGETISARAFSTSPGGKGANQALAARRAGAAVALFGAVGRDAFAVPALSLVRAAGIGVDGVREVEGPTGIAMIHVDARGENIITVAAGANANALASQIRDSYLDTSTTVLLQFEAPIAQSLAVAQRARSLGARVVLNCAPAAPLDQAWLQAIDVLIANAGEADAIARADGLPSRPAAFVEAMADRHGITTIVTLGAQGVVAATSSTSFAVPALPVDVVDTVGAGDAFVGVLAAKLDGGQPLASALVAAAAAVAAAALSDSTPPGIGIVTRSVARARIAGDNPAPSLPTATASGRASSDR